MADIRTRVSIVSLLLATLFLSAVPVGAQDPPPRIGPFVIDFHATVPKFPSEDQNLADSRGMKLTELPGRGLGVQVGAHLYVLRLKAITFGVGGEYVTSRSSQTPAAGVALLRPAKERFTSLAPQLSFNFGTGHGWSYLSGGLGRSTWSLAAEGTQSIPLDDEPGLQGLKTMNATKLKTINYGGGGRWFMKSHLAFSFDVRFYAINPGAPYLSVPGTPRTTLLVIGAGASFK
jgi:hypothetical protein